MKVVLFYVFIDHRPLYTSFCVCVLKKISEFLHFQCPDVKKINELNRDISLKILTDQFDLKRERIKNFKIK